jgi:thermostable 8-oxoguanine DNA glycosylase
MTIEAEIENQLIEKLKSLKYEYRPDIRDRDGLVKNFREKFQALNRVNLTEAEFDRLLEKIITPDVFAAAKTLRTINDFNDYNLNISRYISTAAAEAEIDLAATHEKLVEIEDAIKNATKKHNEFLKELGLPPLPSRESNSSKE